MMKKWIYMVESEKGWEITEAGEAPDNCDATGAIGRPPDADEAVGCGTTSEEAMEDALLCANTLT